MDNHEISSSLIQSVGNIPDPQDWHTLDSVSDVYLQKDRTNIIFLTTGRDRLEYEGKISTGNM